MPSYLVDLLLQFGPQALHIENLVVTEFSSDPGFPRPYAVLVGRDVISRGVFTMDFTGRFTFSL